MNSKQFKKILRNNNNKYKYLKHMLKSNLNNQSEY